MPITLTKPKRRGGTRRRRLLPRVRSKRHGVLAAMWAIIAAAFTIAWLTLGGVLWFAAALLGALAVVITTLATFDPETVVPAPAPKRAATASARGNGSAKPRRSSSGTVARTSPAKPRKQTCSARCRNSTKAITDCRCVCGGKTHGARRRDA